MTRQEFYNYIYDHVSAELKDCYEKDRICLKRMGAEEEAAKNGDSAMFLIYFSASKLVSSMKNLDEMYELYLTGTSTKDIIDESVSTGRIIAEVMNKIELNRMNTYEENKDRLFIRLCPKNREDITYGRRVSVEYEYFRADLMVDLGDKDQCQAMLPVLKGNLKKWGMSRKEVFEQVLERQRREGIRFFPIGNAYHELIESISVGTNYYGKCITEKEFDNNTLFTLTTQDMQYGASLILDEEVLGTVYEMFGKNYIILPSSTHELMVFPDSGQEKDEILVNLVTEINGTGLIKQDCVCDMAFYFDGDIGKVIALPDRNRAKEQYTKNNLIRKFVAGASA